MRGLRFIKLDTLWSKSATSCICPFDWSSKDVSAGIHPLVTVAQTAEWRAQSRVPPMLNNECFYLWILTPVGISVECNCSSSKLTRKSIISLYCKIYGQGERKKSISRFRHSGVVYTRTLLREPRFVFYTFSIVSDVLCPLTDRLQIIFSQTAQLRTGNTRVQKFQFRLTIVMLLKRLTYKNANAHGNIKHGFIDDLCLI